MATELPKQYDPKEAQERWLKFWEEHGYFHSRPDPARQPFCIVIPPPNVTGALHMGHALNNTLQDVLIRWRRMQGYNALYMPGTDHAGIATQAVVERRLFEEEKKTRRDLGREALVQRIWEWKDQYETRILKQLRELGCSCDWPRTRFTLDPICARAVRHTFFNLFRDGLIYRGKRLVNWDTHLQTAVADDEIFHETVKGGFWTFRYPVKGSDQFIRFSTTRPETMLGDAAVAVHPDDERYKHLIGSRARLPLANRLIPIVADSYSDPEKGTGAVKITPAHDFNDFEVGRRHGLPSINILLPDGRLNDSVPQAYRGLDRFEARKRVLADLESAGLIEKTEEIRHAVPHDEKTKTVVLEPYLTEQWYLNVTPLAEKAVQAVEEGRTRFVPEHWGNVYYNWMRNIQPWCISRQLWWGHQIPAWYGPDGEIFVEETEDLAFAAAQRHYGTRTMLTRDEDVLDTWFSSALWPFSTLGWPDSPPELKRHYPTDVLVTGLDIIFFWVDRL